MLDFVIFAGTFLVFLLILVIYLYPGSNKATTIPGLDPSDPKEGNLTDIIQSGSLHSFLVGLHKDHGPIASFWMGSSLVVSLASPELFEQYGNAFEKPADLFQLYKPMIGENASFFLNGPEARKKFQTFKDSFCFTTVDSMVEKYFKMSTQLVEKWGTMSADQHIPLTQYMIALTMKSICNTLFPVYFSDDRNVVDFSRSFEICWRELELRAKGSIPNSDEPRVEKFEEAVSHMKTILNKALKVELSKESGDANSYKKFVNSYSTEDVVNECLAYTLKYYSIASALSWMIYFLATHSDVEKKLYEEIKNVVPGKISKKSISELRYLKNVINETLRTALVEPWTARYQDIGVEIGGHVIPKKTPVIQALGVALHCEKYWSRPQKFDLEHFNEDFSDSHSKFVFVPFGFSGQRTCPGQDLAYMNLAVYAIAFCSKFEFQLVPGQVVVPQYGIIAWPEEEIWITVKKRK